MRFQLDDFSELYRNSFGYLFLRRQRGFDYVPNRDIIKSPLPLVEEIAREVSIQLREVVKLGTQSRRDLEATLLTSGTEAYWFPDSQHGCEMNFALNKHIGAEGAMSSDRVQDPEGAKTVVISYATTAGATTTVIKRMFQITCYIEPYTTRLRVDRPSQRASHAEPTRGPKRSLSTTHTYTHSQT